MIIGRRPPIGVAPSMTATLIERDQTMKRHHVDFGNIASISGFAAPRAGVGET